ncbi:MAG: hypothetical protein ABI451_05425 [Dokdonella sp.]
MTSPIYFPILRAKAGEIDAIGRLAPKTRILTCPLLDFPVQSSKDSRSLEHYFAEKIREIKISWGTGDEIYLDFSRYEPETRLPDGQHVVDYVFDLSRQSHLKSMPVVAPLSLRGPGTSYFDAVSRVAAREKRGVALRISSEDFIVTTTLRRVLGDTANLVSTAPGDIDVYLDAESLNRLPIELADEIALSKSVCAAAEMTLALGYRRVIFAASSMPDSMTHHEKGEILHLPRAEFRIWRQLASDPESSSILFGDYGVIYPTQSESDAQGRPPSRIRITTVDEYVLYKDSPEAIRTLSRKAVDDGALNGLADSWGASAVRECAAGYGNKGNATTWVARDTNMHIENTVAAMIRHTATEAVVLPEVARASTGIPWLQDSLAFPDSH